MDSKRANSVTQTNHASTLIRKERLSPTSKAKREASLFQLELFESIIRVKNFREVDLSKNRLRARPRLVKPIRNGLRKKLNSIKSRPARAATSLAGGANEVRIQKK